MRCIVLPNGISAPLSGCMIIDVPFELGCEPDEVDEWIAENADNGYSLYPTDETVSGKGTLSYYDLINNLLMDYSDEQLMQTATVRNTTGNQYGPLGIALTDDSNDCVPTDHIILTQFGKGV